MLIWSQTLTVRWPPDFEYYDKRTAVLRWLRDRDLLTAFRVQGDRVQVTLGDKYHAIDFGVDGVDFALRTPEAEYDRCLSVLRHLTTVFKPVGLTGLTSSQQLLSPVDVDYAGARQTSARALASMMPSVTTTDYAVLLDLTSQGGLTGQLEFGVIRSADAWPRLARFAGRVGRRPESPNQADWNLVDLPDVSLFVDLMWHQAGMRPSGTVYDTVESYWSQARSEAELMTGELHQALFQADEIA